MILIQFGTNRVTKLKSLLRHWDSHLNPTCCVHTLKVTLMIPVRGIHSLVVTLMLSVCENSDLTLSYRIQKRWWDICDHVSIIMWLSYIRAQGPLAFLV